MRWLLCVWKYLPHKTSFLVDYIVCPLWFRVTPNTYVLNVWSLPPLQEAKGGDWCSQQHQCELQGEGDKIHAGPQRDVIAQWDKKSVHMGWWWPHHRDQSLCEWGGHPNGKAAWHGGSGGLPGGTSGKEPSCQCWRVKDVDLIPGPGRSPGGGHGNPLQCSCLENPHGQRSLAGYSPRRCRESSRTARLNLACSTGARNRFVLSHRACELSPQHNWGCPD